MIRLPFSFDLFQRVSSTLSILLIFLMSAVVAYLTLKAAENVIDTADTSAVFRVERRNYLLQEGNISP